MSSTETEMKKPEDFSLLDPAVQQCPFEFYKVLRDQAPVFEMPDTGMYIVTSYDLLREIMTNPKVYSNIATSGSRASVSEPCPEADRIINEEGYGRFMPTVVNNDPPGHGVFRSKVDNAFRASRIRQMEEYVTGIIEDLIDGFVDNETCEAVYEFSMPVPMYVIADQLGVPRANFKQFKEWSDAWVAGLGLPLSQEEQISAAKSIVEMQKYLIERMDERREAPKEDILSDLVQATYKDERPLSEREVLSMCEQILVAGNETTTNGIASALQKLASDLELQERLRQNPSEIAQFVEEVLRWESPVAGLFRYVMEDTELGGVKLPKGATVMIRYASANRDETRFDDGEDFKMGRRNGGAHLAFGSGTHHCVGSELARVEMRASVAAWLRRFKKFELDQPTESIQYHFSFALRGPQTLKFRLEKA